MLFATPDFGAGAMAAVILLAAGLAVLIGAFVGIVRGCILLERTTPGSRRKGLLLLAASLLLPVACCCGPGVLFRLSHDSPPLGAYPNGTVQEGMSSDDIRARLGGPHEVYGGNGQVRWLYWLDSFQLNWFMVHFGPDGRVVFTSGN